MPTATFPPFPHPTDQTAHAWIVGEVARQGGRGEAVYTYDLQTGTPTAQWHEARAGADIDPALAKALLDGKRIVLHHNHPSNGSFISLDLQSLVGQNQHQPHVPGLAAMWAHGNNGPHYRIALSDPAHASAVVKADQYLTALQSKLSVSAGGHEIFASGWRHLVCLCLERKGYVNYEYDLTKYPNYQGPTQRLDWVGRRLTMQDALPLACDMIVNDHGSNL